MRFLLILALALPVLARNEKRMFTVNTCTRPTTSASGTTLITTAHTASTSSTVVVKSSAVTSITAASSTIHPASSTHVLAPVGTSTSLTSVTVSTSLPIKATPPSSSSSVTKASFCTKRTSSSSHATTSLVLAPTPVTKTSVSSVVPASSSAKPTTSNSHTSTFAVPASSSTVVSSSALPTSSAAAASLGNPAVLAAPQVSGALSALRYTGVGAGSAGTYQMVTSMATGHGLVCDTNPSCTKTPHSVSGPLGPFKDDLTFLLRGPVKVNNIAVYQPQGDASDANTWSLSSSFTAGQAPKNLVFMNNDGGGKSGEWDICNGASQSYADSSFTTSATSPATAGVFSGTLPATYETNIMTSEPCSNTTGNCLGYFRGTANKGWDNSKLFVISFSMPGNDPAHMPALWALDGQIVRSAQYGCNCRGQGATGCAELDIVEVIGNQPQTNGYSEIYTPNGASGSGEDYFPRPMSSIVTYATLFDMKTDSITIIRFDNFDYTQQSISRTAIDAYVNAPAKTISFANGGGKKREHHTVPLHHQHRRRFF